MPSITFSSSLTLTVYQTFPGGGAQLIGCTPGLLTFSIGPADSWFVYSSGALTSANISTLVDDLNTYAVPSLQITKNGLTGTDLAPLTSAVHLNDLFLSGDWTDSDFSGFTGLTQLTRFGTYQVPITDAALTYIGTHTGIEFLDLSRTQITGSGLGNLSGLSQLKTLILLKTLFDPTHSTQFINLPTVRYLNMLDTNLDDTAVGNIAAGIPDMLSLSVDRNQNVTDASVMHFVSMSKLNTLSLESTGLSNAGIVGVLALPELIHLDTRKMPVDDTTCQTIVSNRSNWQVLVFENSKMTDDALTGLPSLTQLKILALRCSGVTSAGIANLNTLTELEDLDLGGCNLDDSALPHLYPLKKLRVLNVTNTGGQITQAGIDALLAETPGLQVESDFSSALKRPESFPIFFPSKKY